MSARASAREPCLLLQQVDNSETPPAELLPDTRTNTSGTVEHMKAEDYSKYCNKAHSERCMARMVDTVDTPGSADTAAHIADTAAYVADTAEFAANKAAFAADTADRRRSAPPAAGVGNPDMTRTKGSACSADDSGNVARPEHLCDVASAENYDHRDAGGPVSVVWFVRNGALVQDCCRAAGE